MHSIAIFLTIGFLYKTEGLDVKLPLCRFQCQDTCKASVDKSNPNGVVTPPGDYYWRDFYGVIPPDAYPLGSSTQFPQTYIGFVYDPVHSGTFASTIYDGLDYVYNANNGNTTKISKHIQVLGSNFQDKFEWVNTTIADFPKIDKDKLIPGGMFSNGTDTYVCRNIDDRYGTYYPGSARVLQSGTYCHSYFGPEDKFQVLVFNQEKK